MTEDQIKKCHDNYVGKQMVKALIKESNDKLINDIALAINEHACSLQKLKKSISKTLLSK